MDIFERTYAGTALELPEGDRAILLSAENSIIAFTEEECIAKKEILCRLR